MSDIGLLCALLVLMIRYAIGASWVTALQVPLVLWLVAGAVNRLASPAVPQSPMSTLLALGIVWALPRIAAELRGEGIESDAHD